MGQNLMLRNRSTMFWSVPENLLSCPELLVAGVTRGTGDGGLPRMVLTWVASASVSFSIWVSLRLELGRASSWVRIPSSCWTCDVLSGVGEPVATMNWYASASSLHPVQYALHSLVVLLALSAVSSDLDTYTIWKAIAFALQSLQNEVYVSAVLEALSRGAKLWSSWNFTVNAV